MDDLEHLGTVVHSSSSGKDVTTQVIDVQQRLRTLQDQPARPQLVPAPGGQHRPAAPLRERHHPASRRVPVAQGAARPPGRTRPACPRSTSTSRSRPLTPRPPGRRDHAGFLTGLRHGWTALTGTVVVALTAVGAVLPFAVVLAAARPAPVVVAAALRHAGRGRPTPAEAVRRRLSPAGRRSVRLHELREPGELVGVGRRDDAVAEVEDVALRRAAGLDDLARRARSSPRSGRRRGSGRGCPAPHGRPPSGSRPRAAYASRRRRRRRRRRPSARAGCRCRPRSGSAVRRARRPPRARARSGASPTPGSRPGSARRPTSRTAGSRTRRPRPAPRRYAAEMPGDLAHQRVPHVGRAEHHRLGLRVLLATGRPRRGTTPP